MAISIKGEFIVAGYGSGEILFTRQNISFWGGVDPTTGIIVDPRHELFKQCIAGKVLAFPYGKGSAAAPLVVLEMVRQETVPAAIINTEIDPLLVAGPIIGRHFYKHTIPVVILGGNTFSLLETGMQAVVDGNSGEIVLAD